MQHGAFKQRIQSFHEHLLASEYSAQLQRLESAEFMQRYASDDDGYFRASADGCKQVRLFTCYAAVLRVADRRTDRQTRLLSVGGVHVALTSVA